MAVDDLPRVGRLAAVCAHPDDESFGMGAVLSAFVDAGSSVEVVCFTRGEASTLGTTAGGAGGSGPAAATDLASRRTEELHAAARVLGIDRVVVGGHPDGRLHEVPVARLASEVVDAVTEVDALLTFDHGGITGHPDHQRATDAAVAAAGHLGVPVLAWAIPAEVAAAVNAEFGTGFVGRAPGELDLRLRVDRRRQEAAMACHDSQLADNPVPRRRIELQGPFEHLRVLAAPGTSTPTPPPPRSSP